MSAEDFINDDKRWKDITAELDTLGREILPNAPLNGFSQIGNRYEARLSQYQAEYHKSPYFYEKEKMFFHLTSLPKLFSIVNDRAFRFYDLNSSNDANEFHHAAKILGIPDHIRNWQKSRVYSLSFCPISEIGNEFMWENYGDRLGGAAIVFSIRNHQRTWRSFHMSEIYYQIPDVFYEHLAKITTLARTRNADVSIDWTRIAGFHKNKTFDTEKEVRILTVDPFESMAEKTEFLRMDYRAEKGRNRMTYFFKLPIWIDNKFAEVRAEYPSDFLNYRPQIKIEKILFGKNIGLDYREFQELRDELNYQFLIHYGYKIEVRLLQ